MKHAKFLLQDFALFLHTLVNWKIKIFLQKIFENLNITFYGLGEIMCIEASLKLTLRLYNLQFGRPQAYTLDAYCVRGH